MEIVMVSAIGSPPTFGFAPTPGSSTAGIEAQIIRYKKELSDCVNCVSANTTEGKAAIAAAASKVGIAEARIESIAASNQNSPAAASTTTAAADFPASAFEGALTYERTPGIEFGSASKLSDSSAGTLVDVFA
jgi:hypothetical protein